MQEGDKHVDRHTGRCTLGFLGLSLSCFALAVNGHATGP